MTKETVKAPVKTAAPKKIRLLALLIAAHNEELVIEQTVRSAIAGGMDPADIYIVDDNSSDSTSAIGREILGAKNILRVDRSGKGLALTKANKHFKLSKRYLWIHIADADGGFAPDYFDTFRDGLDPAYAAATGYVRSLPGHMVSQYRVFEYTLGMEIHRRFQALTHTVSVIPGPTSCFRSDVFDQLDFANKSLTEDFDVTLQIHRKKLGRIKFIPKAVAYTQDPRTVGDFMKQITRWNRGILQGVKRHKVGRHANRIDAYLTYQILQNFLAFVTYCVLMPYAAISRRSPDIIAAAFLFDVLIILALTAATAAKARRWDILSAFPFIYAYRWITLYVFIRSFIEVIILGKYGKSNGVWSTAGRRYKTILPSIKKA